MRIDVLSIFPEMFNSPLGHSIMKRAIDAGLLTINITNPRDYTTDKHHVVDDYPFGGGAGMVMKPEPFFRAAEDLTSQYPSNNQRILLMCPGGTPFCQQKALQLAQYEHLIILCGHYEGIDERVRQYLVHESLSIGDYVLTGGELPAMVVIDAVARLLPGVLGCSDSAVHDSFCGGLLEHPQYTRPRDYNGMIVPEILLSGDHAKIDTWRRKMSLKNTYERRPDLLVNISLNPTDAKLLNEIIKENTGG